MKYSNGESYEGEFLTGMAQGYGKYNHHEKSIIKTYIGYWRENKKHGFGVEVLNSG